jgi:hypothetical protein
MATIRSFLLAAGAALALAGSASAAFPGTYGIQNGVGVPSPSGSVRYVATHRSGNTLLAAVDARSGKRVRSATLHGSYGIPTLITTGEPLGMFRDGRTFVLQSTGIADRTSFVLVRTSDLRARRTIALAGSYAFDAVSPNGARLYLVQHRSEDFQHYVVRAYDLRSGRLLPGRVADKTQASWVMQGWPASRVETRTGRWVYTLYSNPGGYPFVHALDTVRGVAHCVGFAWSGSQDPLMRYRLAVRGNRLLVLRPDRSVYRSIDRTTWAVALR